MSSFVSSKVGFCLLMLGAIAFVSACNGTPIAKVAGPAPSVSGPARGRVKVVNNSVLTDQGTLLRGGTAWIFKWGFEGGSHKYTLTPEYWNRMHAEGFNACRIICFDPWQKSNNYVFYDLTKEDDAKALLDALDTAVNFAEQNRMYAVINYHDVGKYDMDYLRRFWTLVAPRYAGRTHVLYELANEPVSWYPEEYKPQNLRDQEEIYSLVRKFAPQTHIMLLTFANPTTFNPKVTMQSVAAQLKGIDWSNASIAFHPYNTKGNAPSGSSKEITELKALFPVVNTEQNLPNNENCIPMDGELWGVQTMERLGISWFTWQMEGPEKFEKNYVNGLKSDAIKKGYFWKADR